jgi:hypothetical protein
MKLLYCPHCHDIFNLKYKKYQECQCGKSSGYYTDDVNAVYSGDAIILGIANSSFIAALENRPESGMGSNFNAWVMPEKVDSLTYVVYNNSNQENNY